MAPAEIRTRNLPIAHPALYNEAASACAILLLKVTGPGSLIYLRFITHSHRWTQECYQIRHVNPSEGRVSLFRVDPTVTIEDGTQAPHLFGNPYVAR